jgi:hypothetical protein
VRIRDDEKALEGLLQESPALNYVRSLPGMGPILAAVVLSEIDGIERFLGSEALWLSFRSRALSQDRAGGADIAIG